MAPIKIHNGTFSSLSLSVSHNLSLSNCVGPLRAVLHSSSSSSLLLLLSLLLLFFLLFIHFDHEFFLETRVYTCIESHFYTRYKTKYSSYTEIRWRDLRRTGWRNLSLCFSNSRTHTISRIASLSPSVIKRIIHFAEMVIVSRFFGRKSVG